MGIFRKLINYFFKKISCEKNIYSHCFRDIDVRTRVRTKNQVPKRVTGCQRVKILVKKRQTNKQTKMVQFCRNCLKSDGLTGVGGFKWLYMVLAIFNRFNPVKIERQDFLDSND